MAKWDRLAWERWLIRLMSLGVVGLGYIGFRFNPDCSKTGCPAYALSNSWILRGERAGVLIVGTVIILSIVWRMIWHGRLPDQVGQGGVSWKESVIDVNQDVIALTKSLDALDEEVQNLKKRLDAVEPVEGPAT